MNTLENLMKYFVLALALGFALVSAAYSQDKKETKKEEKKADSKIDAAKIVGKWDVIDSDAPKGAITTIEFTKDGKLVIKAEFNGKSFDASGTYSIKDDQITIEIKGPGGESTKETETIVSLSDKECQTKDKKGKVTTFKKK